MLTTTAYAEQIAAGDTGWWRCAVRRAAAWISPQHPTIDLTRWLPLPQLMVQTAGLVVYGLARSRDTDPRMICAGELLDWVAAHQLPDPPESAGHLQVSDRDTVIERARLWRHEVDVAVERQQRDLAALLRLAGHSVPEPAHRSLDRFSADPVIATWLNLVDKDPPAPGPVAPMDVYPSLFALGLTALRDIA